MKRVSMAQLEAVVTRINKITKSPEATWTRDKNNKFTSNIGNYHLDGAYGGWTLHRIMNESGGVTDVLRVGHVSKRELLSLLFAYIQGLEDKGDQK